MNSPCRAMPTWGRIIAESAAAMKSIIVYSRELKPQNLYPKRIVSPPAPNKCCPRRMEVLGRPRLDEHGRRFSYKRCQVCGFALRHFLDSVGTVLTPATPAVKGRNAIPLRGRPPVLAGVTAMRTTEPAARKVAAGHHPARKAAGRRPHGGSVAPKTAVRRRR